MGKKRNTAKTGDKAIYKSRTYSNQVDRSATKDDDDDPLYGKVDRFHNKRNEEFLKLDGNQSESEEEVEAVMDLGIGGEGDESEESDSSGDDVRPEAEHDNESSSGDEEGGDLSESENDEFEVEDVRDWGKKKGLYYHGDTADLEIGQDEEDAYLEEEAAMEVQAARFKDMDEEDFLLSDKDEKEEIADAVENLPSARDLSKLTIRDRQKVLDKQHPEMLPVLSYFSEMVRELDESTIIATKAIFEGEEGTAEAVGTTKSGKRYLLTKALLQSSTALNLLIYLLLKADNALEEVDSSLIRNHPVMARLQKLNDMKQKLEEHVETKVSGLSEHLLNLVKAAKLTMTGDGLNAQVGDETGGNGGTGSTEIDNLDETATESRATDLQVNIPTDSDDESDGAAEEQRILNEARFGLRPGEIASQTASASSKRRTDTSDFGDDTHEDSLGQQASRSLASTLNTLEQKSNSKKRRAAPLADELDDAEESEGELRRGLDMMEETLGKDFDKESDVEATGEQYDAELDDADDDGFYAQIAKKSKSKKDFRKRLHEVAPKFPRMEMEVEGERPVSRTIVKNRGLVAHKSKLNRNPRVKKREQYRKALIRRKGAVRTLRTDEGHKYGGEETGIKSGVSRSRKIN